MICDWRDGEDRCGNKAIEGRQYCQFHLNILMQMNKVAFRGMKDEKSPKGDTGSSKNAQ